MNAQCGFLGHIHIQGDQLYSKRLYIYTTTQNGGCTSGFESTWQSHKLSRIMPDENLLALSSCATCTAKHVIAQYSPIICSRSAALVSGINKVVATLVTSAKLTMSKGNKFRHALKHCCESFILATNKQAAAANEDSFIGRSSQTWCVHSELSPLLH